MTERKKTGRPSKGDRHKFNMAEPIHLSAAVRARAKELGMTVTDYYLWLASRDTGVPAYPQEGLSLGLTA